MDRKESDTKTSIFEMTPRLRKKSNLIVRGTSLLFDEIKVAKEEENQLRSWDEIEEENDGEPTRYVSPIFN